MSDPVIATDGFTYERSALVDWMGRSMTSPKTGEDIEEVVIPNKTLKTIIREWKESNEQGGEIGGGGGETNNGEGGGMRVCRRGNSRRFQQG